ncbi:hypothetical protein Csa_003777 [Cucumis sativus]|uniref:Uncharacterized protein n=1 Tax=Cucumis sativus TaxID=3659 RepID=A0A0A0KDV2_CUCSA|nr:hypothetical protein Csa_003777 [Cucumis sativus]
MNTRTESQVREREGGKKDESVGWGGCCLRVLHKSKEGWLICRDKKDGMERQRCKWLHLNC